MAANAATIDFTDFKVLLTSISGAIKTYRTLPP
jgi:hypothetical protein